MPKLTTQTDTASRNPLNPTLSQQPPTRSLQWKDSNGQNRQLTLQQLERWFATLEKNDPNRPLSRNKPNTLENNTLIAADFLARFGLQASNIMMFLQSPAATPILSLYTEALHEIAAQEEAMEQIAMQEESRQRHRRHALLLLALLFEADLEAHEQDITNTNEEQLQKLHAVEKAHKKAEEELAASSHEALERQINEYRQAFDALSEKMSHKLHESSQMDHLLSAFETEKNSLDAEFSQYAAQLEHLNQLIQQAEKQENPQTALETHIAELEDTMNKEMATTQQHIVAGDDAKAQQALNSHQMNHLRLTGLRDMLAVYRQEKYLVDAAGEPAKTMSRAHFLLPYDKKIVRDKQGQLYLIPRSETLESLQARGDGKHELALAHQAYQKACRDNLCVHQQFAEHKNRKTEAFRENHERKYQQALVQSQTLQSEILLLSQQANKLKRAQDRLEEKLAELPEQRLQARPKPTPQLKTGTDSQYPRNNFSFAPPTQENTISRTLQLAFKLMLHNRTPANIEQFKQRLTTFRKPEDPLVQAMETQLNTIKRIPGNAPIPPQTMQNMLKTLDQLGVSTPKPESTAPNPFSMSMKGLKPY